MLFLSDAFRSGTVFPVYVVCCRRRLLTIHAVEGKVLLMLTGYLLSLRP